MGARKTNLKLGLLAALMLAALFLSGCGNTVDDFRQVKAGMSLEQVRDLLGEPDEVNEAKGLAGVWVYHSSGLTGEKASLTVSSMGGKVMLATINKK
jgi:hypothetical protein